MCLKWAWRLRTVEELAGPCVFVCLCECSRGTALLATFARSLVFVQSLSVSFSAQVHNGRDPVVPSSFHCCSHKRLQSCRFAEVVVTIDADDVAVAVAFFPIVFSHEACGQRIAFGFCCCLGSILTAKSRFVLPFIFVAAYFCNHYFVFIHSHVSNGVFGLNTHERLHEIRLVAVLWFVSVM